MSTSSSPDSRSKSQKKRGKINIVACDRCKRDKKRCDGNYLTQKTCEYCQNHNEICVYSEPNFLRISRILNAAAKNAAAEERESDDREKLQKQLIEYESIINKLSSQLEIKSKTDQSNTLNSIEKLYISLFANSQISIEQTMILKKLCEITHAPINLNVYGNEIRNKLSILETDTVTDEEKRQCWEELDKFIKMHNDSVFNNIIQCGFSHPSVSTTPIPSPQFLEEFNTSNDLNDLLCTEFQPHGDSVESTYDTTIHRVTTPKKRNALKAKDRYEPYPPGGYIAIRPSKKETNIMVWHQNDPSEDVPIIAVPAPHNKKLTVNSNEALQNPNVRIDNFNEVLQFPTSNIIFSSNLPYGFDKVGQFSNVTSPTFSSSESYNSDDNFEYPTFLSDSVILDSDENWLEVFPNSSGSYNKIFY
ncbi:10666_t:CDS:1 [Funneliformis caledonium]|uniref:10666_t:CDS:1 n=1 Tax=Funneliformis caledonium TaxID=1117310 RepID=A0A9N9H1G1_9GLOM|nr:10666_t:CDS:1 [Funneliformis caledonium]